MQLCNCASVMNIRIQDRLHLDEKELLRGSSVRGDLLDPLLLLMLNLHFVNYTLVFTVEPSN